MAEEAKAAGNKEFQAQNFSKAIEHFTKAIDLGFKDAHVIYSNRSACYCGLRQYDDALADASKCIESKPDWGKVCSPHCIATTDADASVARAGHHPS